METKEELIRKYADTCVMLRNAELSRSKEPVEEKSFMDVLCDNKWKVLTGLVVAGAAGAAGMRYNVFKDLDKFLSTGTGKIVAGAVTAGTTTVIKYSFTGNQPTILKKIPDSELTPEFNYYRKLNPSTMSETELEYNITLMEGIIGAYKPTVVDTEPPTGDFDSIRKYLDKYEPDGKVSNSNSNSSGKDEIKDLTDKYFPDEDEEFMLTEN